MIKKKHWTNLSICLKTNNFLSSYIQSVVLLIQNKHKKAWIDDSTLNIVVCESGMENLPR